MTNQRQTRQAPDAEGIATAIPSAKAVAVLKAEAQRLRAEVIGGAFRRVFHGPRAKATGAETVEVPVQNDWYAPVIRSVLDKFAHQVGKGRDTKAANTDHSNRAA